MFIFWMRGRREVSVFLMVDYSSLKALYISPPVASWGNDSAQVVPICEQERHGTYNFGTPNTISNEWVLGVAHIPVRLNQMRQTSLRFHIASNDNLGTTANSGTWEYRLSQQASESSARHFMCGPLWQTEHSQTHNGREYRNITMVVGWSNLIIEGCNALKLPVAMSILLCKVPGGIVAMTGRSAVANNHETIVASLALKLETMVERAPVNSVKMPWSAWLPSPSLRE